MILTGGLAVSISCHFLGVAPTAFSTSMVYVRNLDPVCGVLWEGYTGAFIEAKPWTLTKTLPPQFVVTCLHYAFVQLGVAAVLVAASTHGTATKRAIMRLGGQQIGKIAGGHYDGSDLDLFTIKKEDCEFLINHIRKVPI